LTKVLKSENVTTTGDDRGTTGDDGDKAGGNLLMDRVVLGARVRWEPNLTEAERESGCLFLF